MPFEVAGLYNFADMKNRASVCQIAIVAAFVFAMACYAQIKAPRVARPLPEPPPLPWKSVSPPAELPGETVPMENKVVKHILFIPKGWTPPANGEVTLTAHFHGAYWFSIQEHLARGLKGPLVNFDLGHGSDAYRNAFENETAFAAVLKAVEKELQKRSGREVRIATVDISSFSAGYGAVRELLKTPEYFDMIRRIVLLDSLYARYPSGERSRKVRQPAREHIEPWVPFAEAAIKGTKTFLITYSEVPTPSYASSAETAAALLAAVGLPGQPVAAKSTPAASDPQYPLLRRADLGRFHVWGYAGKSEEAHLVHARHLSDFWLALDAAN